MKEFTETRRKPPGNLSKLNYKRYENYGSTGYGVSVKGYKIRNIKAKIDKTMCKYITLQYAKNFKAKIDTFLCKHKIFLTDVCMIFKYSK